MAVMGRTTSFPAREQRDTSNDRLVHRPSAGHVRADRWFPNDGYSSGLIRYCFPRPGVLLGIDRQSLETGFTCNAAVPHGATVTAVRFTVFDNNATKIVSCVLARQAFLGGLEVMADQSTTGEMNQPGPTQLLDTTITDVTVDNNNFAYSVLCQLGGTGRDIGLYGSSIEYTITGTG
jgi:hypothetical protein